MKCAFYVLVILISTPGNAEASHVTPKLPCYIISAAALILNTLTSFYANKARGFVSKSNHEESEFKSKSELDAKLLTTSIAFGLSTASLAVTTASLSLLPLNGPDEEEEDGVRRKANLVLMVLVNIITSYGVVVSGLSYDAARQDDLLKEYGGYGAQLGLGLSSLASNFALLLAMFLLERRPENAEALVELAAVNV